jgi:hypothetical protein
MTPWDDNKSTASDPDNPSASEQLTANEWDTHVGDQKDRLLYGPLTNRPSASNVPNGTKYLDEHNRISKVVSGAWTQEALGNSSNPIPDTSHFEAISTERLDTTPTLNHIATLGDSDLGRPHDIEIADGLAVIPGKDGNVSVVSLYPRNSPTLLGTDTSFSNAQAVAKYPGRNERYMWAVADDANLQTVLAQANGAVSSISSASLSTSQANGTAWYKGQESEPVSLFVAEKGGELSAYDMSGYDSISRTVTEPVNSTTPHDVAVMDTRVITCSQADGASPSVEVLNAINGSGTNIQPTLSTDGMITDPALNGANRLERYGHYVIVAANRADTLSAIDLSDFTNPTIADSVPTAGHASGLTVVGDFAITASQGTIEVFDISDPTAISLVDSDSASGAADHDMAVDGRFLYVTGQSADELQVCKIGFEYATTSRAQDLTHGSS